MIPRAAHGAALVAVGLLTAVLYCSRLDRSPIYIFNDESQFILQAQAVAATGRDLNGHMFPVYFAEPEFEAGRDPGLIYFSAALYKVLPFSEAFVRWPTALIGVANIVLVFTLVSRLFGSILLGATAAMMLALTPEHFMRSRLMLSPLASVPFVLLWLLSLLRFGREVSARTLAATGLWLGLGIYTYLGCVVMMPLYLALTVVVTTVHFGAPVDRAKWAVIAFVSVLLPIFVWHIWHPERVAQIISYYRLFDGPPEATGLGLGEAIRLRMGLYWSFFNPEYLFLSGDSSIVNSTRQSGLLPLSFAILLPVGAYHLARNAKGAIGKIILVGLLSAPLASVVTGHLEINRLMFVLPFACLVATTGVWAMATATNRLWRAAAMVLVAGIPLQFAGFYSDYMGSYRVRAAPWFGGNLRDAMVTMIDRENHEGRALLLGDDIEFARRYWRLYSLIRHRPDPVDRPVIAAGDGAQASAPSRALLVCKVAGRACRAAAADATWRHVMTSTDPDGQERFLVYERE